MAWLVIGLLLWCEAHLFKRMAPRLRAALGHRGKIAIAAAVLASVALMAVGFGMADGPVFWPRAPALVVVNNVLVAAAFYLFAASVAGAWLARRMRHPQLAGFKLWAAGHLLVNGELESILLFGGLLAWAVVQTILINRAGAAPAADGGAQGGAQGGGWSPAREALAVLGALLATGAAMGVHDRLGATPGDRPPAVVTPGAAIGYGGRMRLLLLAACVALLPLRAPACGLALALAVDVSGSVDPQEYELQMRGLAEAMRDSVVSEALVRAEAAVVLVQWTGTSRQDVAIPWTRTRTFEDMAALADRIEATARPWRNFSTAIGDALAFLVSLWDEAPDCKRNVIDVSGDGVSNEGREPRAMREGLAARGITVNALAIEESEAGLTEYFRTNLITGKGAFVVTANTFEEYPERIRRKLIRETSVKISCLGCGAPAGRGPPAGDGPGGTLGQSLLQPVSR